MGEATGEAWDCSRVWRLKFAPLSSVGDGARSAVGSYRGTFWSDNRDRRSLVVVGDRVNGLNLKSGALVDALLILSRAEESLFLSWKLISETPSEE